MPRRFACADTSISNVRPMQPPHAPAFVLVRSLSRLACLGFAVALLVAGDVAGADLAFPSGVLDRQALNWTSGGRSYWFPDSAITRDVWSGHSGWIGNGQESWIQTTVLGPARFSFQWKVQSNAATDFLRLRINGTEVASISGNQDWTEYSHAIATTGVFTIQFAYTKNSGSQSAGDSGWVDSFSVFSGETGMALTGTAGLAATAGTPPYWTVETARGYSVDGSSIRSGAIGNLGTSSFSIPNVPGDQYVSWAAKVSSEASYDILRFYIDGTEIVPLQLSGEKDWVAQGWNLTSGNHTLTWAYTKDESQARGSDAAWLDRLLLIHPPAILTQPVGGTFVGGGQVSLSALAGGGVDTTLTWKKGSVVLANGTRIRGADTTNLFITGFTAADVGSYTLTVSNKAGVVISSPAVLAIAVAPSITTQPVGLTVLPGFPATFTVAATGTAPLSYQWTWNGSPIAGATDSTYSLPSVSVADAGTYAVTVSNGAGTVTSRGATLVVPALPEFTLQPTNQNVLAGSTLALAVRVMSSDQPVSYQWWKGGVAVTDGGRISGATSSTLTLASAVAGDSGSYSVVAGNSVGNSTSVVAVINVQNLNHTPTLSPVADVVRLEDAAPQTIPLAGISDGDGGTQTVSFTATSSNPGLVPHPTVTYANPSATGSLQLTSVSGQSGTALITVRARDDGGVLLGSIDAVTRQFQVTVTPVNDAPTLNQPGNVSLVENVAPVTGGITNDFSTDTSGGTLHGNASRITVANGGVVEITPLQLYRSGAYFLNDVAGGQPVSSFNARLRVFCGPGSPIPADGLSFNFMGENPALVDYSSAENGVGTGLSVGFHIYTAGGTRSAYATLRCNGTEVARKNYQILYVGSPTAMALLEVVMTSDRKVTVRHGGTTLFDAVQTTCNPAAGWRFGVAGRTGGESAWQLIDDFAVSTTSLNASQIVPLTGITDGEGGGNGAGQVLDLTATSGNPALIGHPIITYASPQTGATLILPAPARGASGSATISVRVRDDGGTANGGVDLLDRAFTVTVVPINHVPTLNSLPNLSVADTAGTQTVNLAGISDGDGGTQAITLTAVSSNPSIIPTPTITYSSPGATGTLRFTPVVGSVGTVTLTVTAQDNGGTANNGVNTTNQLFTVKVGPVPPAIDRAPEDQIALVGSDVTFPVVASGNGLTYKWFKNSVEIPGATTNRLTLPAVDATSIGTYRVQVFNANNQSIYPYADALLSVVQAPARIAVLPSQRATFTNVVTSPVAVSVQWLKDGQPISGATGNVLAINTAQTSDSASYTVRVTAGGKTFTTPDATLRLIGSIGTLFNTGVGPDALRLGDGAEDDHYSLLDPSPVTGTPVAVVTTGSYPIPPWIAGSTNSAWISPTRRLREAGSEAGQLYTYRTVFDLTGVDLSTVNIAGRLAADDTVTDIRLNGTSVGAPSGVTSNGLSSFVFEFAAAAPTGRDNFADRDSLGGATYVVATANNTHATEEPSEPFAGMASWYRALNTVWWSWTAPASESVTLDTTGSTIPTVLGVFSGSSLDQLTSIGVSDGNGNWIQTIRSVTFNAVAGTQYQICVDGCFDYKGDITLNLKTASGSVSSPYTRFLPPYAPGTNTLDFIVKNTADPGLDRSLTGLRVEFTNAQAVVHPVEIITQPVGGFVTYGDRKAFSVGTRSGAPVAYQWFKDNVAIEGATESSLVYNKVDDSDAGSYTVRVTNINGERWSAPAVLTVDVPLGITFQPADVSAALGQSARFTVRFRGNAPLGVQWQRNGSNIAGASGTTLTLPNLRVSDAGRYTAVVSDRDTTLTSDSAALVVVEPPRIVQQPGDFSGVAGRDSLTLESIVDGSSPIRYRWFLGNTPLATDNSPLLNLGILRESQAGSYRLIATNLAGAVTSRIAQVTAVSPPAITNSTGNLKAYVGEAARFAVNATGSGSLAFQWYHGGQLLPGQTSSELTYTNLAQGQGGEVSVVVRSPYGTVTHAFKLEVYPPPVPVVSTGVELAQEFTLQPGWNAVFLNVQPAANKVQEVFSSLPISSLWRWADPRSGPQFISDQSEGLLDTAKWQIHLPTNRVESFQNNLFRVFRHSAYLLKLETNQPVVFTVVGQPGYQRQRWAPDAYTLTGFPVREPTNAPTLGFFFKPSAAHYDAATDSVRGVYRLQPDGSWVPLGNADTLRQGEAYWVYTRGASDYLAPLEASFQGLTSLNYGVGSDTKEFTLNYRSREAPLGGSASASLSHLLTDQSLPLQISEFIQGSGNQWRDLPNGYSVGYSGLSSQTLRLGAKRERITGLNYAGILTLTGSGVLHTIPVTVDRDEPDVAATTEPFNPVGLWLGNVTITHVSEVNGLTTNYVVTRITNVVDAITNVVEEPTLEIRNVSVGSLPTPVKDPFEMRLILHDGTNGVCQLLQQVTLLTTEARQTTSQGTVTRTTGGDPVLVTDPALLTQFKGVALRGRETIGRRFSSPFYPMDRTNGVPFDGPLGLGRSLVARWSLPAGAPLNPFQHKYHPDHDNLDASFKVYQEEAFTVRRTVRLDVPSRQGSGSRPGMGQDEIEGTYLETLEGLHRTPITVRGTFHLKRILAVGALNPAGTP